MSTGHLVLVLLIVGVLTFAMSLLVRRLFPRLAEREPAPAASTLSYVAAAYGVLVGFAIVFLLGQVGAARQAIGSEATSIGTAFDEAQLFPQGEPEIQHSLICYSKAVSEREWPALADGTSAPEADQAYRELIATYGSVDQPTGRTFQPAAATNSFVQIGGISTARETRLVAAEVRVGPLMWSLLLGGALLALGLIFLLSAKASPRAQATFVSLAAIFTTVMLLLVLILSHPFRDAASALTPRLITENTERMTTIAPEAAARPCSFDEGG